MTTAERVPNPISAPQQSSETLTLTRYLEANPWPAQWLALGTPQDFLWHFDLDASPEALWPYVADTSSFNRRAGFGQMRFVEKNGKMFGTMTSAGTHMAWEEVPWEWEHLKSLGNTRIYSEGFLQLNRARYL